MNAFGCYISDEGVRMMSCYNTLEVLDLSRTQITSTTLDILSQKFERLKMLIIGRCNVSADSITVLQNCRNVVVLKGAIN